MCVSILPACMSVCHNTGSAMETGRGGLSPGAGVTEGDELTRAVACPEDSISQYSSHPQAVMSFLPPLPGCSLSFLVVALYRCPSQG